MGLLDMWRIDVIMQDKDIQAEWLRGKFGLKIITLNFSGIIK